MGKVLIVGASKGIGAAIADSLKDHEIINISRSPISNPTSNITQFNLDVIKDELPEIEEIDSIIYCPGSINLKPLSSLSEEDFLQDFTINVLGAVRVIKAYQKVLKKSENASITMFSTVAVAQGMPFHSSVAVAKAGVEGLTRSLAAEFSPTIRVNCIAPTVTNTELAAGLLRNEKAIERIKERHPLKKIVEPSEIANLVTFLIGSNAKNISGQTLAVDGGLSRISL